MKRVFPIQHSKHEVRGLFTKKIENQQKVADLINLKIIRIFNFSNPILL